MTIAVHSVCSNGQPHLQLSSKIMLLPPHVFLVFLNLSLLIATMICFLMTGFILLALFFLPLQDKYMQKVHFSRHGIPLPEFMQVVAFHKYFSEGFTKKGFCKS